MEKLFDNFTWRQKWDILENCVEAILYCTVDTNLMHHIKESWVKSLTLKSDIFQSDVNYYLYNYKYKLHFQLEFEGFKLTCSYLIYPLFLPGH